MPIVEVRFRVKDDGEFKRAMNENKRETDVMIQRIKEAGKQVGSGLIVGLKDARSILGGMGNDTKRFEKAMVQAGMSVRDAKNLTAQLNKELNDASKGALGIEKNQRKANESIRDGVFAAKALEQVFERARKILDDMAEIGGVKGLKESTEDAKNLQTEYDKLQRKLLLTNDPGKFAQVRSNIEQASIMNNVPQSSLISAVSAAQETKTAGMELAYDNGGALLRRLSKITYADDIPAAERDAFIKSQVVLMKDLGLSGADQLAQMQGITRAGEHVGALGAKDIALKGGSAISQLAGLRNISGIAGYREGQALLQTIGDAPGISGDVDKAVNRSENLVAKLADSKTLERLKEATGVNVRDKKGFMRDPSLWLAEIAVSQKGGKFKIPETDADLKQAENDPKKASQYKEFFEIFHDMQAREGFLALYKGREKYKQLRDVDYQMGLGIYEASYEHRIKSTEGQLDQRARRDELTHAQDWKNKAGVIVNTANVMGQFTAEHPYLEQGLGMASDLAGVLGPKWKMAADATIAGGVALAVGTNIKNPRDALLAKEHAEQRAAVQQEFNARRGKLEEDKNRASVLALRDLQRIVDDKGIKLEVNVQVTEGMKATVTTAAKSTKQAAQSGTRKNTKNGQH